jgi:uncharacterized protein
VLAGPDAARLADELLRAGRPFHAHEVLEASWKTGPARERDLWQGLAQVAVGLTHARRGNARGAVALLSRGAQRVRAYQAAAPSLAGPYGMDLTAFLAASDDLAARIERDGLAGIPDAALRPGLRALCKPTRECRPLGPARAIGAGEQRATPAGPCITRTFAKTLTAGD